MSLDPPRSTPAREHAPVGAPALALRALRVVRGRREVLQLEALEVAPGETLAVLGANGAGKSTLLLAAALLLTPATGDVRLFGQIATGRQRVALRRQTATVFQDAALLDMPVRRNVETALAIHGVPRGARRERAQRWLDRLGVGHLADARPHTLSGGEAQRVSLARAFAVEPRLLFLDEPFASLDYAARAQLTGDLRALLASEGTAALLATHDHSEAELLAERALVLIDGREAQLGPVEQVFARPASLPVARFLGYSVLPAALLAALLDHEGGAGAAGAAAAAAWGLVPPRAATLADAAAPNAVAGTLTAVQGALGQGRLLVDVGAALAVEVPVREVRARALAPGATVHVRIDPAAVAWL